MLPLLACAAPLSDTAAPDCPPETRALYYRDADGDGAGDKLDAVAECGAPDGYVESFLDCDDAGATIGPHAADDTCDGVDQDCDAIADDGAPTFGEWYEDGDGDGWGAGDIVLQCDPGDGSLVPSSGDCDDARADVNPLAREVCDDLDTDEDCDGYVDNDDLADGGIVVYSDADGDGFGSHDATRCEVYDDWVAVGGDCDDANADISPAAAEVCDTLDTDEDCDGSDDEADAEGATTWYEDSDANGFGTTSATIVACDVPEGYTAALATPSDDVCSSAVWNDEADVATTVGTDFAFAPADAFTVRFRADLQVTGGWVLAKGDEWGIGADPIEENGDLWICLHPIVGDPYGCMQRSPGSPADYVVTYDAGEVSWYVDGVSQGEPGYGTTNGAGGADLVVGDPTDAATGTYDDVTIWSTALSADDVASLHSGSMVTTGLVGWWRFDEGSGTSVADLSGRGNDLALAGPEWAAVCF